MDDDFPAGMVAEIERFLAADATRPAGLDLYPEVFESQLFFPLQRMGELAAMMRITRQLRPRIVAEVGSDKAGSLYHWCKSLPSVERVLACEVRGTPYDLVFEDAFPRMDFLWLPCSSYEPDTLEMVKGWLGRDDKIDCLFLDGDKSWFKRDFDAYLPFMARNGIVFMHDILDPAPRHAFEQVKAMGYRTQEVIDRTDTEEAFRRKARYLAPANPHEAWLRRWAGTSAGLGVIYLEK